MDVGAILLAVASIAAAYFIGAIPFGVVVPRVLGGRDPRTMGSGRTGGANVLRAAGARMAIIAGGLDLLKGSVAVLIPLLLSQPTVVTALCVLAVIIGHSRSIYIGFHGGRGVSPAFGALLVLWPWLAIVIVPIFLVITYVSRYSSLASLTCAAVICVVLVTVILVNNRPPAELIYAIGGPALIWIFHWDNIQRLLSGTERTIDSKA